MSCQRTVRSQVMSSWTNTWLTQSPCDMCPCDNAEIIIITMSKQFTVSVLIGVFWTMTRPSAFHMLSMIDGLTRCSQMTFTVWCYSGQRQARCFLYGSEEGSLRVRVLFRCRLWAKSAPWCHSARLFHDLNWLRDHEEIQQEGRSLRTSGCSRKQLQSHSQSSNQG